MMLFFGSQLTARSRSRQLYIHPMHLEWTHNGHIGILLIFLYSCWVFCKNKKIISHLKFWLSFFKVSLSVRYRSHGVSALNPKWSATHCRESIHSGSTGGLCGEWSCEKVTTDSHTRCSLCERCSCRRAPFMLNVVWKRKHACPVAIMCNFFANFRG